jgi:hypothetical protein
MVGRCVAGEEPVDSFADARWGVDDFRCEGLHRIGWALGKEVQGSVSGSVRYDEQRNTMRLMCWMRWRRQRICISNMFSQ